VEHTGFDSSTLLYWRKTAGKIGAATSDKRGRAEGCEETGIVRGRRKHAVDSTILVDAVASQDTITQLISAIRRVGGS
jgi:hypothetical protein